MDDLGNEQWVQPLLGDINNNGGLISANKSRFFELRFGYALHQAGITPQYEVPGEARSTLDFGFTSTDRNWLVELMRLENTLAVLEATKTHVDEDGVTSDTMHLATGTKNSVEGETLKAVERICQKCEHNRQPHKFPTPSGATSHVILVDIRNFIDEVDDDDLITVGLGSEFVSHTKIRLKWEENLIYGVFNKQNSLKGAKEARERVHFIGFVNETEYSAGGLAAKTQFIANPFLFATDSDVKNTIADWPLQPEKIMNSVEN
jgi:hypothetical protein